MSFRRRNKSNKVPNVKLRPAQPTKSHTYKERETSLQETWMHTSGLDSEPEASIDDVCPRPFKGIVLCATGISDKTAVFKHAIELGAECLNDLTDRVTHLVAIESGSAKYRCALENKIPIMHPSWVTDSHEIWLKGDDLNLQQSVDSHRLPIFSGVILTLSGIDDVTRRTEINRLLTRNGGTYAKNLERPVKVTHLLCASGVELVTEKMRYAEKFNQRGEARIKIVWEEWFWDSLDFRGRFDEEAYKVSKPPPQRKMLPEAVTPPPHSSSSADEGTSQNSHHRSSTNELLATSTNDEEEIASARRVPAEMLQIWSSLLKPRGFEVMNGRLVRSPSKFQSRTQPADAGDGVDARRDQSPTRDKSERIVARKAGSIGGQLNVPVSALSTFRRTKSFAPVAQDASTSRQPFRRAPTAAPSTSFLAHPAVGSGVNVPGAGPIASSSSGLRAKQGNDQEASTSGGAHTLFIGKTFRTLGEARGPSVRAALEECGARLLSDGDDEEADFILVRLVSGSSIFREETDEVERSKFRTECWLEQCIFEERICAPDEHVAFTPLSIAIPVPGAEMINLSHSGLDQSEACWLGRLMRAIGANVSPTFSRRSTHLLCPSASGLKAEKAREWHVPVVDMTWLAEVVRTGQIPQADTNPPNPNPHGIVPVEAVTMDIDIPKAACKGKGKEKDTDVAMIDITHDSSHSSPSHLTPDRMQTKGPAELADVPSHISPQDGESFGQPNELLGGPYIPKSPNAPPSLSRSMTNTRSDSSQSVTALGRVLVEDSRAPSVDAIEPGPLNERIPSSESPSPLKLQPQGKSPPRSPLKISKEATKALQDSITTLLGKRPSTEDEESSKSASSRLGKRARPPSRAKLPSMHDPPKRIDPEVLPVLIKPGQLDALGDDELNMLAERDANESMRVIYDDPGQRAEKTKLMRLLSSQKREVWEMEEVQETKGGKKGKTSRKKGARGSGI